MAPGSTHRHSTAGGQIADERAARVDETRSLLYCLFYTWPDAANTPFRSEKNSNWEGAYRVPCFVRWPGHFPAFFVFDRIWQLAPQHPDRKTREPFASVLRGDVRSALAGGEHALVEMGMATHAGTTTEVFEKLVSNWLAAAKHPTTGRQFTEMVYQPMLEVLAYLRANGFRTFIRQSSVGRLDKGLDKARAKGWTVVDMKRDWKRFFPKHQP